jgi:hypothetical protein
MLYPLTPANAAFVRPLFPNVHLAVAAALVGTVPAEIYVDDPLQPRAATVILPSRRVYLAGTPENEAFAAAFGALLRQRYLSLAASGPVHCAITFFPGFWSGHLPAILSDIPGARFEREYYACQLRSPVPSSPIAQDVMLRLLDEALLVDTTLANYAVLMADLLGAGPSVSHFLARRFGYCLLRGRELAAWCLSEYNTADRCELSVQTMPLFRHRGFARVLGLATLRHAQSVGMTSVGWHCWQSDATAISLALKLGFYREQNYPVWYCRFGDPVNAWRTYPQAPR